MKHPPDRARRTLGTWIRAAAFLLGVAFISWLAASTADAHAPKTVQLAYDTAAQSLRVTLSHPSPSPGFHYINRVVVKKNGQVVETAEYTSQPNTPDFTYVYKISAAPGDTLEVKATCNLWGSKTEKLTVPPGGK